jgi:regulatory protein
MKITAIKQQVKQQGRYSIFVEGKYSFSLSDMALLDSKIVNGQELTEEEVRGYKKLSLDDKLYNRTLQYVAIRPRSTWEVEFYLKRKDADPLLSSQIVNKLSNFGHIDDLSFARSWVSNRRLLKATSLHRLRQELRQKHVPDGVIQQVLQEDETDERTILRELVAKKRKQTKYQDDLKLMQFLARQGFNYDDIKSALQVEETED